MYVHFVKASAHTKSAGYYRLADSTKCLLCACVLSYKTVCCVKTQARCSAACNCRIKCDYTKCTHVLNEMASNMVLYTWLDRLSEHNTKHKTVVTNTQKHARITAKGKANKRTLGTATNNITHTKQAHTEICTQLSHLEAQCI